VRHHNDKGLTVFLKDGMPYGEPVGQSLNKEEKLNVLKGIKKRIEKIETKTKKEAKNAMG